LDGLSVTFVLSQYILLLVLGVFVLKYRYDNNLDQPETFRDSLKINYTLTSFKWGRRDQFTREEGNRKGEQWLHGGEWGWAKRSVLNICLPIDMQDNYIFGAFRRYRISQVFDYDYYKI
jgi:hypothetical protein